MRKVNSLYYSLSTVGPVRSEGRAVDDLLRFTVERGKNITLHCYLEGNKLEYMVILLLKYYFYFNSCFNFKLKMYDHFRNLNP